MQVAPAQLLIQIAILVVISNMCYPLPLSKVHSSNTSMGISKIMNTVFFFNNRKSNGPENTTEDTSDTKNNSMYQAVKSAIVNRWAVTYGREPVFLPVRIPHGVSRPFYFIQKFQQVIMKRRRLRRAHNILLNNFVDIALLITLLVVMIITMTSTVWIRRQRSLDFVRSATIQYNRSVDTSPKSELSEAKQVSNVFGGLGATAPLRTPEICFPDDFVQTDEKKEVPCVRIKLLTQEDIAREEF